MHFRLFATTDVPPSFQTRLGLIDQAHPLSEVASGPLQQVTEHDFGLCTRFQSWALHSTKFQWGEVRYFRSNAGRTEDITSGAVRATPNDGRGRVASLNCRSFPMGRISTRPALWRAISRAASPARSRSRSSVWELNAARSIISRPNAGAFPRRAFFQHHATLLG